MGGASRVSRRRRRRGAPGWEMNGAFFGEGPGVDARAPIGERGGWAERHRRLRAGAEEAPEEQRDEQRGASGPHGGAPADVTAFSNGRLVTRKISHQKMAQLFTWEKSRRGRPWRRHSHAPHATSSRISERANDRGGAQRPPGQEDPRQVQVRNHQPTPSSCPFPSPHFSPTVGTPEP